MTKIDFSRWTNSTAALKPGEQAVFLDMLNLVMDGKVSLVHGADYRDGKPCLVNGVATMISHSQVSPMGAFPDVVGAFDAMCRQMVTLGLSDGLEGYVSPLMAEVLIRNFGEVKPIDLTPEEEVTAAKVEDGPYVEPSDEQFLTSWLAAMQAPAPEVLADADNVDPDVEYARSFVNVERP